MNLDDLIVNALGFMAIAMLVITFLASLGLVISVWKDLLS